MAENANEGSNPQMCLIFKSLELGSKPNIHSY